jgi:thiol-disulfide isomerase/thioredoxin
MLIRRFASSVLTAGVLISLAGCSNAPDPETEAAAPLVTPEVKVADSSDVPDNSPEPMSDLPPFDAPGKNEVAVTDAAPDFSEPMPSADGGPAPLLIPPEPESMKTGKWLTILSDAKELAAAQGKDILLDFTGSDWCGYCIQLDQEVFSDPEFTAYATKNLVLVELDFPKFKTLSVAQRKHNAELEAKYEVQGFPTLVMLDAAGRKIGKFGYEPGGFEVFQAKFNEARDGRVARDAAFDAAKTLTGIERAKKIDEGLNAIADINIDDYRSQVEEVAQLDADNAGGVGKKWRDRLSFAEMIERVRELEKMVNADEKPTVEQIDAAFDKAVEDFANFKRGQVELELFRVQVYDFLEVPERAKEQLQKLIDDKGELEPETRFRIFVTAARLLLDEQNAAEALKVLDTGLAELKGSVEEYINLLLTKAQVLNDQDRTDEAHAQFGLARKVADPELIERLNALEIRFLGKSTAEPAEADATETPASVSSTSATEAATDSAPPKANPAPADEK